MEQQWLDAQERKITPPPAPQVEAPVSAVQDSARVEPAQKVDDGDTVFSKVVYRNYDSDDIIRMRSASVITGLGPDGKPALRQDAGMAQKTTIVLGVRQCPWFSDNVDERFGVTEEIYNRRMYVEFRRIPVQHLDRLFKEASKHNKLEFNAEELRGK
jgi:hypothetical protein